MNYIIGIAASILSGKTYTWPLEMPPIYSTLGGNGAGYSNELLLQSAGSNDLSSVVYPSSIVTIKGG